MLQKQHKHECENMSTPNLLVLLPIESAKRNQPDSTTIQQKFVGGLCLYYLDRCPLAFFKTTVYLGINNTFYTKKLKFVTIYLT